MAVEGRRGGDVMGGAYEFSAGRGCREETLTLGLGWGKKIKRERERI